MKLSSGTNSMVINTESVPNNFDTVVEVKEMPEDQKRSKSTRDLPTPSKKEDEAAAGILSKRHSDRSEYKHVKF